MNNLSSQIEQLNNYLLEDNKRILQLLSTLNHNNILNWKPSVQPQKSALNFYRKSKGSSLMTSASKKLNWSKDGKDGGLNSSFKTVKKLKSPGSKTMEKCGSCKLFKKTVYERSASENKNRSKQLKDSCFEVKKQTNFVKLTKLSQKMIPNVSNKYIFLKKSSITHFCRSP